MYEESVRFVEFLDWGWPGEVILESVLNFFRQAGVGMPTSFHLSWKDKEFWQLLICILHSKRHTEVVRQEMIL